MSKLKLREILRQIKLFLQRLSSNIFESYNVIVKITIFKTDIFKFAHTCQSISIIKNFDSVSYPIPMVQSSKVQL